MERKWWIIAVIFLAYLFKSYKFFKGNRLEEYILLSAAISLFLELFPIRSTGSLFSTGNATYIILVASNFHQYRAFLTFVQELYNNNLEKIIKIYNAPCILPWFKSLDWGTRHELLEQEFIKIEQYQLKQDVCSYKKGLKYLQWVEQQA